MMESQAKAILEHLQAGRALDPLTALRRFGCYRLGARIFDLRRAGHKIRTTQKAIKSRTGHRCMIAIYTMEA